MIRILKRCNKTLLVLLLALVITGTGYAQEMTFYYPDGKPYKRECKNILDINNDFDKSGRIKTISPFCGDDENNDCFTTVGFKLFTNEPLWILTNNPERIEEAIKTFDRAEYLQDWQFESDLRRFIKKNVLSDIFILETLGQPTDKVKYADAGNTIERWTYAELNLSLTLKDGIVYSFIR